MLNMCKSTDAIVAYGTTKLAYTPQDNPIFEKAGNKVIPRKSSMVEFVVYCIQVTLIHASIVALM